MIITSRKRIYNIENYLGALKKGQPIFLGVSNLGRFKKKLNSLGYNGLIPGEQILPSVNNGPISRFNAEGKFLKRKDLPMETAYREIEWEWKQWDGTWHSKFVDVPYQRYPRDFIPPSSLEPRIAQNKKGQQLVLVGPYRYKESNYNLLINAVNLFLELFKECEVFTGSLDEIIVSKVVRLNWEILPKGRMPWDKLKKHLDPIIKTARKGNQVMINHRFKLINSYKPDYEAIGINGFKGYVVFAFEKKKLYILESTIPYNATYVFDNNWEEFSAMTKAEILNNSFQKARIIHRVGWDEKINKLFRTN